MKIDIKMEQTGEGNYQAIVSNKGDLYNAGHKCYAVSFAHHSYSVITSGRSGASITTGNDAIASTNGSGMFAVTLGKSSAAVVSGSGIAMAMGLNSFAMTGKSGGIVLAVYNNKRNLIRIISGVIGDVIDGVLIEPDTEYTISNQKLIISK